MATVISTDFPIDTMAAMFDVPAAAILQDVPRVQLWLQVRGGALVGWLREHYGWGEDQAHFYISSLGNLVAPDQSTDNGGEGFRT
jgi:hypothetical protein